MRHAGVLMTILCLIGSITIFISSVIVANKDVVYIGLGNAPKAIAVLSAMFSAVSIVLVGCLNYGYRKHNKFALLIFALWNLFASIFMLLSIGIVMSTISPAYSSAIRDECKVQQNITSDRTLSTTCSEYFQDSQTLKIRDMWTQMFVWSVSPSSEAGTYAKLLEDIQSQYSCCGFYPPNSCTLSSTTTENVITYASDFPIAECGVDPYYYPASSNCEYVQKNSNGDLYTQGCPYFLPGGTCGNFNSASGCIDAAQQWAISEVSIPFGVIIGFYCVNILIALVALCLVLKRKYNDVLPTSYVVHHREAAAIEGPKTLAVKDTLNH